MKTPILLMATLLGLAVAATQAQTQSTTTTTYVQTSKIVGMKVKDSSGQEIGVVKDVVLDRNSGCMAYTVLSTGGTSTRVTGGGKTVAVPWSVYTTTSDPSMMTVRVERDRIYNAPAFDYARIDEYSTSGYINNVYSYYGVTPGVGVGVDCHGRLWLHLDRFEQCLLDHDHRRHQRQRQWPHRLRQVLHRQRPEARLLQPEQRKLRPHPQRRV